MFLWLITRSNLIDPKNFLWGTISKGTISRGRWWDVLEIPRDSNGTTYNTNDCPCVFRFLGGVNFVPWRSEKPSTRQTLTKEKEKKKEKVSLTVTCTVQYHSNPPHKVVGVCKDEEIVQTWRLSTRCGRWDINASQFLVRSTNRRQTKLKALGLAVPSGYWRWSQRIVLNYSKMHSMQYTLFSFPLRGMFQVWLTTRLSCKTTMNEH